MREIKFRAWYEKEKCFIKADSIFFNLDGKICGISDDDGEITEFTDMPFIIEQFTGLYDCDGTEIYEGDIIQSQDAYNRIKEVFWDNLQSRFTNKGYHIIGSNCKVIGNIHE